MAKSANQKLKLLYILKILKEQTDEKHALSTSRIIELLAEYDIQAERKSIYDDMLKLGDFGYDILCNKTKENNGYYLASREFELPELKLLVDAVQSSKFITKRKSRELIGKLETLTSSYEAKELQRSVYVADRAKTMNESIYYNVDAIHRAMNNNVQISFQYSEWGTDKKLHPRKEGKPYQVSPYQLIWDDANYYLVAYDEEQEMLKHYRVDKMSNVWLVEEKRRGSERFKNFNPAVYSSRMFGMYGGAEELVQIRFSNHMIGVVMDRFGTDVDIRVLDDKYFSIRVYVMVSPQFFGWLAGLGKNAMITGPKKVADSYRGYLQQIVESYESID